MRNYVQPGDCIDFLAPTGGVVAGTPVLIGSILVIPTTTAAEGVSFAGCVTGVFTGPKAPSQAWTQGQQVYWDAGNARFSSDPSVGPHVGIATAAVADGAGDTTGSVRLGVKAAVASGGVFTLRKRVTVAQVNAGLTILAALAGVKYRLLDAFAIAIGGAATTGTTIDILGTTTTEKKLVAFGQAALTQNALVRAGAAGGVILADGASFVAQDVNTAIRILKTGTDFTVMTNIDVVLTYAMDPA